MNGASQSALLTVQPRESFTVALSPATVKGGNTSTFTVTLASAAPTGGLTFVLTNNNPAVVSFPASTITIAAGQTTGTATVNTTTVTANTPVSIAAVLGTTSKAATLKVTP